MHVWGKTMGQNHFCRRLSQIMPPLTEVKLRTIRPSGKIERFHDEKGLYLEISKAGGKYWRWKYRFEGKEKRLSLGSWPDVGLKKARDSRDEFRRILKNGNDPAPVKKSQEVTEGISFRSVAETWRNNMENVWAESHAVTVKGRLELDVYPAFGDKPPASLGLRPPSAGEAGAPMLSSLLIRDSSSGDSRQFWCPRKPYTNPPAPVAYSRSQSAARRFFGPREHWHQRLPGVCLRKQRSCL
jgi:hypothetical protein